MSDLRDHSQPCEHEFYLDALDIRYESDNVYREGRLYYCHADGCPGGREVTEAEIIAKYLGRTNATGGNVDAPAI